MQCNSVYITHIYIHILTSTLFIYEQFKRQCAKKWYQNSEKTATQKKPFDSKCSPSRASRIAIPIDLLFRVIS